VVEEVAMLDFLARRLAIRLAGRALDSVSPSGKRRREEEERVATMFGYGGMTEPERYREAVRREAERKIREREMQEDIERLAALPEHVAEAMGLGGMTGEERRRELVRRDDARVMKQLEAEANRLATLPEFSGMTEDERRLEAARRMDAAGGTSRWERYHEAVQVTLREGLTR
jgi:hypothetical protein